MYKGSLVKYYDDLYEGKDYSRECSFITDHCHLKKTLDIGCGTGTHLKKLHKHGSEFYGIDISSEAIEIAQGKFAATDAPYFEVCRVEGFTKTSEFDTIISMFNVVNHILDLGELESYFAKTSSLLGSGGTFIFDCFNGAAVFKDAPRNINKVISSPLSQNTYSISSTALFTPMTAFLKLTHTVDIIHRGEKTDKFTYNLEHRIWMPSLLKSLAEKYNMKVEKIVAHSNYKRGATAKDYKISFICKK
jgi:2-polyprenyl-3-methyl-5-hydroxy-6-metoxy-1,4-benzoquinol methylase